ncbi:hypothetical protein HanIR_Chr06g0275351 [Helianthus annuus]|nr:hypothetical protein HanIR_Chr06g0275351 [Helianthus annuus]
MAPKGVTSSPASGATTGVVGSGSSTRVRAERVNGIVVARIRRRESSENKVKVEAAIRKVCLIK